MGHFHGTLSPYGFNELVWTCQSTLKSCFCDFPFSHSPFAHSLFKIYVRGAKNTQPSELLQKRRYMILIREKKEKLQSSSHSKCTTTTSCTGLLRDIIPAKRESIQDKSSLAKKCSIILNLAFFCTKNAWKYSFGAMNYWISITYLQANTEIKMDIII